MATVPDALADLLRDPNFGHLATVRPDGSPQVNPMWFLWDEESNTVRFTHTTKRAKFRNLRANPAMALEVLDPEDAMRFVELRGRLIEVRARAFRNPSVPSSRTSLVRSRSARSLASTSSP